MKPRAKNVVELVGTICKDLYENDLRAVFTDSDGTSHPVLFPAALLSAARVLEVGDVVRLVGTLRKRTFERGNRSYVRVIVVVFDFQLWAGSWVSAPVLAELQERARTVECVGVLQ